MLATLNGTGESLTAVLSSAITTNNPNYSVTYKSNGIPADAVGTLTGTTAKTLLAGIDGPARVVEAVHIYNADTVAVVVTLKKVVSAGTYSLVSVTIPVGGTLRWTQERGVELVTAGGGSASETVGAVVSGIGVTASESGFGNFRQTLLTLAAVPLTITDALAYAGIKLYDFPAGRLRIIDCLTSLAFTTTSTIASTLNSGVTCSYGIGSVVASNATLATTMMNMMPGSGESVKTFTSSTTINVASATVTGVLAAVAAAQHGAILDGTSTPVDLYLNVAVPTDTDIDADATITISGTVLITWINGGDI